MTSSSNISAEMRRKLNIIQQEIKIGTWDNFFLALLLSVVGILITLIITGVSIQSPAWLLIILVAVMFSFFLIELFSLFFDSVFSNKNRFTNKSKFISSSLSYIVFLILLIGLPYLLSLISTSAAYEQYLGINKAGFWFLTALVYLPPFYLYLLMLPRIRRFFKKECPTLLLKVILSQEEEQRKKLLRSWDTTLAELRKLDRDY